MGNAEAEPVPATDGGKAKPSERAQGQAALAQKRRLDDSALSGVEACACAFSAYVIEGCDLKLLRPACVGVVCCMRRER